MLTAISLNPLDASATPPPPRAHHRRLREGRAPTARCEPDVTRHTHGNRRAHQAQIIQHKTQTPNTAQHDEKRIFPSRYRNCRLFLKFWLKTPSFSSFFSLFGEKGKVNANSFCLNNLDHLIVFPLPHSCISPLPLFPLLACTARP